MKAIFLIIGFFIPFFSLAQLNKKREFMNMIWIGYYNQIKLKKDFSINTDLQFRSKNWLRNANQLLIRSGLQYQVNEKMSFTLGGAHFRYFITDGKTKGEWRPWQEFAIFDRYNRSQFTHRFRLEERFIQIENTNEYGFNMRFRYKIDWQCFLMFLNNRALKITAGNEVMLNAGKRIGCNFFDQNRFSVGLLLDCKKNLALQPQYIFISQQMSEGITIRQSNVIRFNLVQKF